MSRVPAHRLAVVRCPTCGRRNATDAWRALRGARARCGRCGSALPRRLSAALVAAVAALAALAVVAAVAAGVLWEERADERRRAELDALARRGGLEELAGRLAAGGSEPAERSRLAALVAARLDAAAGGPPEAVAAAWREGDALLAGHAETWPELARSLTPALERLHELRQADRTAAELEALLERPGLELSAVESAWRDAAEAARRWRPEAAGRFADRLASPWERARLAAARAALREGGPAAARRVLRRPAPAPLPAAAAPEPPPRSASAAAAAPEPPGPSTPEQALDLVRSAVEGRELDELRRAVRVRPGESWGAGERLRLDEAVAQACAALARRAAEQALAAATATDRVALLLEALTCDETLPTGLHRRALAALAMAELEAAEGEGGAPPAAASLQARLGPRLSGAALARLACLAERRGRPRLAVESLLALGDSPLLADALRCEPSLADAIPSSLDHASDLLSGGPQ